MVSVDQIEAIVDRLVVLHKVVADTLEEATLPLTSVLHVLCVQLLLNTFEGTVQLLIVKLIVVLVSHAEDRRDECFIVLVQQNTVLHQEFEEDRLAQAILSCHDACLFLRFGLFHSFEHSIRATPLFPCNSLLFLLLVKVLLILVSHLVKEAITIN